MTAPEWLDRSLYPFEARIEETPDGRIHYLDEGDRGAPPVVLVHGTPTWSFLYRRLIAELRRDHRVVAPDHLGFGLSDKPEGAPYRPEDHAARLDALLDRLALRDVTLVVHDFGGPIGLSWALRHPERVRSVVILNSWMWSLEGTSAGRASRLFGGALGRLLYTRLNFSPRVLLRAGFADRSKLTRHLHRHYLGPFPDRASREAPWRLARALGESGPWYQALWQRRSVLDDLPVTIVWGMDDGLLDRSMLERWRRGLPHARVVELAGVGHFVPEEADPAELAEAVRSGSAGRRVGA